MELTLTQSQITEMLQSKEFKRLLADNINTLWQRRLERNRTTPRPGYKWQRDWIDRLNEENNFNYAYFIAQTPAIWAHKSDLSSAIRTGIEQVINYTTLLYYETRRNSGTAGIL
jgi:hypothetical protein